LLCFQFVFIAFWILYIKYVESATINFPVCFKVVKGATTKKVVDQADRSLLQPFMAAAQELESEGVKAITGSCGFLVLFQQQIADAVNIPVFLSSLIQVPMVYRMLNQNRKFGQLDGLGLRISFHHSPGSS
jgi:hypothetical protein